jgi:hypothetical protein
VGTERADSGCQPTSGASEKASSGRSHPRKDSHGDPAATPHDVTRRLLWIASALAAIAALSVQPARADGDPASDTLIFANAFVPYSAQSSAAADSLRKEIARVSTNGRRVKVAVIASKDDLGAVPSLFDKPAEYAKFLGTELTSYYSGVLLIVMPSGFGVYHGGKLTAKAEAALRGTVGGASAESLLDAATDAVGQLAAAGALAWKDTIAPQVSVAPATGKRGKQLELRYALFDDSGKSSASAVVVRAPSRTVASWRVPSRALQGFQLFTLKWKVPKTLARGKFSFCVTAKDAAGNRSPKTCTPVRIG